MPLNQYESLTGLDVAVEAGITRGEGSDNFSEESAFWPDRSRIFEYLEDRNFSSQAGIFASSEERYPFEEHQKSFNLGCGDRIARYGE